MMTKEKTARKKLVNNPVETPTDIYDHVFPSLRAWAEEERNMGLNEEAELTWRCIEFLETILTKNTNKQAS